MATDHLAIVDLSEKMPAIWTPPYAKGNESVASRVARLSALGPASLQSTNKIAERLIAGQPRGWSPDYVSSVLGGDRVVAAMWARVMGIYLSSGKEFLKDFAASPASAVVLDLQGSMGKMMGVPSTRMSAVDARAADLALAFGLLGKSVPDSLKEFYVFSKFYILCDGMGLTLPFS
jgi:hypothetical protein